MESAQVESAQQAQAQKLKWNQIAFNQIPPVDRSDEEEHHHHAQLLPRLGAGLARQQHGSSYSMTYLPRNFN